MVTAGTFTGKLKAIYIQAVKKDFERTMIINIRETRSQLNIFDGGLTSFLLRKIGKWFEIYERWRKKSLFQIMNTSLNVLLNFGAKIKILIFFLKFSF